MKTRDNTGKFTYCGEVVMRRGYPMLYLPNHHRGKDGKDKEGAR